MTEITDTGPELDINQVREDFYCIWKKNIMEVTLVRENRPMAGDYFHDDIEPDPVSKKIYLNIQGLGTDGYDRKVQGIVETGQSFHAYALWNEDIVNQDIIYMTDATGTTLKFVIKNMNKSLYAGQFAFQEFDLVRVNIDERGNA